MVRVLITEAHDGLGLALVKEYLTDTDNQVVAFCGDPTKRDRLNLFEDIFGEKRLLIVDVTLSDEESIKASVEPIQEFVDALDLLILNHGYVPDFLLEWDVPSEYFENTISFFKQVSRASRWLYSALDLLLERGIQTKFVGLELHFRVLWNFNISKNLGKTAAYPNFHFRGIANRVDPNVVSCLDLVCYGQLIEVIDSDTLETMNSTELVDQEVVNRTARALFDNIPRIPHGKHYYQKTMHA